MSAEREITSARLCDSAVRVRSRGDRVVAGAPERAHQRIDELNQRKIAAIEEADNLAGVPEMISQKRDALAATLEGVEAEQQAAADRLAKAEVTLQLAENGLREADQALAREREVLIRQESACALARQDQTTIVDRIRERLNAKPQDLGEMAGLAGDDAIDTSDEAIAILEGRYERLIRERENVGPVNLRAEEEMKGLRNASLGSKPSATI